MLNKIIIAATAALVALPVAIPAAAQDMNPGKVMLARTLHLDPNKYTLSELTSIEAEITPQERANRIYYIDQQKARGRQVMSVPAQSPAQQPSRFLSQQQGVGRNDY